MTDSIFARQWLQCDAPGCDHREEIPEMSADYIGKPCPKCGASLLTQEDYDLSVRTQAVFLALRELGLIERAAPDNDDAVYVSVNPHKGKLNARLTQRPARNKMN